MYKELNGEFSFIQTEPMEEERVRMGWQENNKPDYVHCFYEEEAWCRQEIMDCDILLFGGCDEESYIEERLRARKPIVRISERLYKTGQWKAISPKGLIKKYKDHTRYRKAPVYLLCAGAYVASDFHIVRAYPGKMFCWGYFPETKHYDVDKLLNEKGYPEFNQDNRKIPYLLWAARFIDWKHPERAVETARYLKQKGYAFHLDMIGGGAMEEIIRKLIADYELEDCVTLLGYQSPEEVRSYMEKADIFLFTSDRQEGWGAVANEAMNSGCALVADHLPGAVPYLIQNGYNGYVYSDGKIAELFAATEKLVTDSEKRRQIGRHAYETITRVWNAENAAHSLIELIEKRIKPDSGCVDCGEKLPGTGAFYPCAPAPLIQERRTIKNSEQ